MYFRFNFTRKKMEIQKNGTSYNLKTKFLNENEELKECNNDNSHPIFLQNINTEYGDGSDDDNEYWIVQCPKNLDIETIKERRLKLPGKTQYNQIESIAEEFLSKKVLSVAIQGANGHYKVKSAPFRGRILVRDKLKEPVLLCEQEIPKEECYFDMPDGLRERHPLYGVTYQSHIELEKNVQNKLHKIITERQEKSKFNITKLSNDCLPDSNNGDYSMEPKRAKKKRKRDIDNDFQKQVSKKKSKRDTENEDLSQDLAWIKAL